MEKTLLIPGTKLGR